MLEDLGKSELVALGNDKELIDISVCVVIVSRSSGKCGIDFETDGNLTLGKVCKIKISVGICIGINKVKPILLWIIAIIFCIDGVNIKVLNLVPVITVGRILEC